MNIYSKTIYVSPKDSHKLNSWLKYGGQCEDDCYTQTVRFSDGIEADINCCGCREEQSWTEMILFKNGREAACTEPCDEYFQEWEITYNGDVYKVNIKEEPLCWNCAYVGDNKSFPQPNDKITSHYYCNCGDCEHYDKDITGAEIHKCNCFEEA